MATVHRSRSKVKGNSNAPAHDWPAWTDLDVWMLSDDNTADAGEPYRPSDDDEAWWDSVSRVGYGGDAPGEPTAAFSPLVWLESQVSYHRSLVREEGDYHDLVATDLGDVAIVLRDTRCTSARALVGRAGHPFSGLDLDAVRLPEARESHAADLLDEQAGVYLAMEGDLARLAAAAILRRADEVEALGARTLRDYYDLEAAWHEAMADAAAAEEVPGYPPLW